MALTFLKFFLLFIFFGFATANAQEGLQSLIRQPTLSAMGGVGVGLADDEYALFNNPAGLAGQEGRKIKVMGIGLEGSEDTYKAFGTSVTAVTKFSTSSLNALMGKDIRFRGDAVSMITLPHFALAYIVDGQAAIEQFNQANPSFKVGDMITHGLQAGMGWSLGGLGKHPTEEFRIGVAGKILWRRGGYYDVSTAGFLTAINSGKAYIDSLVGGYGVGAGADLGLQYVKHIDKTTQFLVGTSITDVGTTKFSDTHAEVIPMNVGFGLGIKKEINFFKLKTGIDFRNLTEKIAFVNKTHIGTQVSIPLFDFYAGLNQMNLTYGVSFDIWIAKLSVIRYTDELGIRYHQNPSSRYMLQLDFYLPF